MKRYSFFGSTCWFVIIFHVFGSVAVTPFHVRSLEGRSLTLNLKQFESNEKYANITIDSITWEWVPLSGGPHVKLGEFKNGIADQATLDPDVTPRITRMTAEFLIVRDMRTIDAGYYYLIQTSGGQFIETYVFKVAVTPASQNLLPVITVKSSRTNTEECELLLLCTLDGSIANSDHWIVFGCNVTHHIGPTLELSLRRECFRSVVICDNGHSRSAFLPLENFCHKRYPVAQFLTVLTYIFLVTLVGVLLILYVRARARGRRMRSDLYLIQ
ncbi:F-M04 protein [Chelonid alphaherpesvirus 5]|uniref:F-M04 protein n=1 Tax=Chelonid alphaherpesvirus 5 TaxID=702736 RepID=K7NWZ1_9ALPH|nr:F-M04 protein [Chelonid alphaherpesvirus 5]AEZ68792.1 F-M04 protein [Chelonid alphaherpesvirus 5]